MVRGIDLTGASSRHHHVRWRGTGRLTMRLDGLLTGVAVGFTGETPKGFQFLRALTRGAAPAWASSDPVPDDLLAKPRAA